MGKRMLIDATHAEETRVVVMNGNRLEEFDVETSTKKQLKGNIYLAKVIRVEPSLQAAFVEYGGNRHGFLSFSEIHPDYYQIPVADRKALMAEHEEALKSAVQHGASDFSQSDFLGDNGEEPKAQTEADHSNNEPVLFPGVDVSVGENTEDSGHDDHHSFEKEGDNNSSAVENVGGEDAEENERPRRRSLRNYKIQDVIKRRQIILIQVVKEERGNKGAALTTFLSLAGRYCVLMPNTARGGGVSRKITNAADRKRLKSIVAEMEIPEGMAVIVRTAGSERTKPEIKRDYEYLLRLWDSIRTLTLESSAPALVYEEANLIKRSIRDLYSRDIDEIEVDGEEGYRIAKDFMRMLMPSHAKRVQLFKEPAVPLFHKFQVDAQLDAMHSPVVQLKSGGYLVINQTEALVAIDVNSGRSTKERHIEETALKTNCEAADEVARQLRLRDLAGLIVIDFIDMEEARNNHTVERRLKEAMRVDRARIQLGRISPFGLMELSRQRLRPSLTETSFIACPHCNGAGLIRSVESSAVHVLRAIEDEGVRRRSKEITVTVHPSIALYILNQKRADLAQIEQVFGFHVLLAGDDTLVPPTYRMDKVKADGPMPALAVAPISIAPDLEDDEDEILEEEDVAVIAVEAPPPAAKAESEEEGEHKNRRRRRRHGRKDDDAPRTDDAQRPNDAEVSANAEDENGKDEGEDEGEDDQTVSADGESSPRRRRRGKRGGRRRNRNGNGNGSQTPEAAGDATLQIEFEHKEALPAPSSDSSPIIFIGPDVRSEEIVVSSFVSNERPRPAAPARRTDEEIVIEQSVVVAVEQPIAEQSDAPAVEDTAFVKPKKPRAPRKTAAKDGSETKPAAKPRAKPSAKATSKPDDAEAIVDASEKPAKKPRAKAPAKAAKKADEATIAGDSAESAPKKPRAPRKKAVKTEETAAAADSAAVSVAVKPTTTEPVAAAEPVMAPAVDSAPKPEEPARPKRSGWWSN